MTNSPSFFVPLLLLREFIWWCITALIVVSVLYPIVTKISYNFLWLNVLFIAVSCTLFRWVVSLRSVPYLRNKWTRFALLVLGIPLFFYILNREQMLLKMIDDFWIDEFGLTKIPLNALAQADLFEYLRMELNFFATGSLILIVLLNVRMISDYWRAARNRMED